MSAKILSFPAKGAKKAGEEYESLHSSPALVKNFIHSPKKLEVLIQVIENITELKPEYSIFLTPIRQLISERISGKRSLVQLPLEYKSMIKLLRNDLDPNVKTASPFGEMGNIFNSISLQENADASYNAYFFEMCLLEILEDQQDIGNEIFSIIDGGKT